MAILMGDVDPCLLGENTLKWIHCDHAGLNGSARPEVFARGIPVTGAAGRSAPVLAEHCIYFMMQGCYHTKELLRAQENCTWGVDGMNTWRGLYGRTVGIVGMGNNGRMLADRLHAFGMNIVAYDKFPIKGYDYISQKYCADAGDIIQPLLEQSDFVVLTLALTDETYHMINKDTLAQMKDGAFLVNMARGGIVCTEDLIEALKSGKLSGAGLDVFEEQPLSPESPLWKMEQVYITPHSTPQVPDRAARSVEIIRENARRFEAGEPLLNRMRPEDAMNGEKSQGGWARMMNTNVPKEKIDFQSLEKYLGKRGWTDPSEWM
ncbi:D-2-hydroxyacid dehydrogenase [Faecalibacterium prausnitzii]|uniref:D-2-hydroxyacid dehydrogenase n=1 Tax=Faecalibacterium prausnitzii TaxID=853 RepID=UPI0018CC2F55|nr:D-2-hydroxyacid dehydrogenase [Faecalibacterium prausnitzii]